MCLVEVEKAPKLAPACATVGRRRPGRARALASRRSRRAKGVLEMLLINHPLDCPICDQSGECELQDYTFEEGRADSRYREPKRFNPVEDFGGDVLYVPNRCILCTRCVRFMDDVAHDPVLERAASAATAPASASSPAHDLTHPWAGNVVDLCPVGALLSKDFLNKARAWELDRAASVCPELLAGVQRRRSRRATTWSSACGRAPTRMSTVLHVRSPAVLDYRWMNRRRSDRDPLRARVRGAAVGLGCRRSPPPSSAMAGTRVFVLASPRLSNEALFLLNA